MSTVTLDWKWVVGLAAGFSTIVGAITTSALLLDRRIETVHNRIEARAVLASMCEKGDTGDDEVDAARAHIISSLGGCP